MLLGGCVQPSRTTLNDNVAYTHSYTHSHVQDHSPQGNAPQPYTFDFWTEEENQAFMLAFQAETYPPDFPRIAARVGTKNVEQCISYTQLYFEALSRGGKLEEGVGLNLSAMDVYTFHHVGPFYLEFLKKKAAAARDMSVGHGSMPYAGQVMPQQEHTEANGGIPSHTSKVSISFLCGDDSPSPRPSPVPTASSFPVALSSSLSVVPQGRENEMDFASSQRLHENHVSYYVKPAKPQREAAEGTKVSKVSSNATKASTASEEEGAEEAVGASVPAKSRKRPRAGVVEALSTEEMDKLVDTLRVPHEKLWEYSSMVPPPALDSARKKSKNPNPWNWCKKVIKKPNGYAQWFPFFAEYINLTKREACEDLKSIRAKAPPPANSENSSNSAKSDSVGPTGGKSALNGGVPPKGVVKGGKGLPVRPPPEVEPASKKVRTSVKGTDGKMCIQAGDFIEVKWGSDWWHAQVIKVGRTSRTGFVWVAYVGGTVDEQEWVSIENCRAPREDVHAIVGGKGKGDKDKKSSSKATSAGKKDAAKSS